MEFRPINSFFFTPASPRPLALLRIALGGLLFAESVVRWRYAVELYSSAGPPMPIFPDHWVPPAPSPEWAVVLQSLKVFLSIAILIGWNTRLSLLVQFALVTWLGLLDSPGTFKKYTVITSHLLLLLACGRPAEIGAVDAWIERPRPKFVPLVADWPRRLIQLMLCFIYFGSAVTKLRLSEFANGDMLEFVLLDDLWGGKAFGLWLSRHRDLLAFASLATVLFEFLFPILVWTPQFRRPMLIAAFAFHLTLHLAMQIGLFSYVMMISLLAFFDEQDFDRWRSFFRNKTRSPDSIVTATEDEGGNFSAHVLRRRILSMVCFLVCGAAVSFACLAVQRQRDWYGVFGNRDMAPFAEIPRDQLDAMLAERLPAVSDHVHRLELGSRIANARVFGDPHRFRHGMKIHALARFTYDRPRMKMAFILVAPGGAEVARQTSELEHASLYGTASFLMTPESPPGRYRVILQLDDYDAAEEWFVLEGESKAVTSD